MPTDNFVYDAFISYRHREPDQTWVRKVLVPQLDAAGLRVCLDKRDFRMGRLLIKEMERAVTESRYTVAVLSPAYLDGNFAELEHLMAEHLGLERKQTRLLLVMRELCDPRLSLRARLWMDLTQDADLNENLERLVREIRRSPE